MSDPDHRHQPVPADASDPPQPFETAPIDATLTERRRADVAELEAAEQALLNAGLDPADPWAAERGVAGEPPAPSAHENPLLTPENPLPNPETHDESPAQPSVTIPEFDPDARGNGYVYLRLADHLAARIKAHDLPPGTQLPAERDLAMQYGVSIGTVRRVAAELRDRDLILTLPAKGTYVRR